MAEEIRIAVTVVGETYAARAPTVGEGVLEIGASCPECGEPNIRVSGVAVVHGKRAIAGAAKHHDLECGAIVGTIRFEIDVATRRSSKA